MKLGVFINQFFSDFNGQISTDLSFIRFIESFKKHFSHIEVIAPTQTVMAEKDQGIYLCSKNIKLRQLPYFHNVTDLVRKAYTVLPKTASLLNRELAGLDHLWIVGPHPLGILAGYYAKKNGIRSFLHIRGNILNDVKARYDNAFVAKAYARYMHFGNRFLVKRMPTLVVGTELFNMYKESAKQIAWLSPSLITEEDIRTSRHIIDKRPNFRKAVLKLLFVGRVEPEKGLDYLFRSLQELNRGSERRYELIIVGGAQRGSEDKEIEIKRIAIEIGINQYISWRGYVPYGEKLKKIYREADIFILPSLAEGIPKVIYEALAFGVPVISTNVGGISDVIKNNVNGILISPKNEDEIISAVRLLAEHADFSQRLIQNGLNAAEKYTIDSARNKILTVIDGWH